MAKQTYSIKAGAIPACCSVILAGHTIANAVYINSEKTEITGPVFLPAAVGAAVVEHFKEVFERGHGWLCEHYDTQTKHQTTKTVQTPAAKNIPGTLVDLRFSDGWRSGFVVESICSATDRKYRINVRSLQGVALMPCAPECVRKSARSM